MVLQGIGEPMAAQPLLSAARTASPAIAFGVLTFDPAGALAGAVVDDALAAAWAELDLLPSQTILLAYGEAARVAFDLALFGARSVCGVIILDPPPEALAPVGAAGPMRARILQRARKDPGGLQLVALSSALHARGVDTQSILLCDFGAGDAALVARAAEVFLAELRACANRTADRMRAEG